jgi:hypothetical protein
MMQPTISVIIKDNQLPRLMAAAPADADRALRVLANEGRNKWVLLIHESPPTGRSYTRGTVQHVASSPGNPPRSDTGTYINSINVQPAGTLRYEIRDGVLYGVLLEFGTDNMEARPSAGPMALWLEGQVPDVFDEFLK